MSKTKEEAVDEDEDFEIEIFFQSTYLGSPSRY